MKTICDSCKNKSTCNAAKNIDPGHVSCSGWTPYEYTNANDTGANK